MNEREAIEAVGGIAAGQWGMFTTAQAKQVDVSGIEVARLVSRGLARRVRHGVHAMVGVPSDQFEDVRAEWLATDPGRTAGDRQAESGPVVVSHETAAHMQGFGEDLPSGGVHLTSTRRIQTRQPFVIIHRRSLVAPEIIWRDGLPLTSPRRTLEDIVSSGRWEHDHLLGLVSDAINRDLILRSDIAKSPVLIEAVPELGPSPSHTAVRQRLTNAARARVSVRLYPIENQIADKLCAMYATYGAGRPSTRYRDLYDLALILDNLPFDREILSAALTTQARLRHVTIPEDFGEPAPGWAADYDKQMGRTPSAREPFTTYDAAMASLRTALNPAF
jgi:Nucleotidyl transferase AbiEii toxin, Type IV TA system